MKIENNFADISGIACQTEDKKEKKKEGRIENPKIDERENEEKGIFNH